MTLSLDTNVIVELVRGRNVVVRSRLATAIEAGETPVASPIVWHELLFGVERHPNPTGQLARLRRAMATVTFLPFDNDDMAICAQVRARLARRGSPIGAYDLLIAGQALAKGWTVVTANTREFDRVEGLNVIDWTAPAD